MLRSQWSAGEAPVSSLISRSKKILSTRLSFVALGLLLVGLVASVVLIQRTQDLRQQAMVINNVTQQSTQDSFGSPVYKIDLGRYTEPVRTESSVIIANGVPVKEGQKLAFSFLLDGIEIFTETGIGSHMVVERIFEPGKYTVEISDAATKENYFVGQLNLNPASIGMIIRTDDGTPQGATSIATYTHQQLPAVMAVNATSDASVGLLSGTLSPYNEVVMVPPYQNVLLPTSTTATVSFIVSSTLPHISGKFVSTVNNPGHKLIYFFLGNSSQSDISLITVPLDVPSLASVEPNTPHQAQQWCEGSYVCEAVPSHLCPECAKQCVIAPMGVCQKNSNGGSGQMWNGTYLDTPVWESTSN